MNVLHIDVRDLFMFHLSETTERISERTNIT